MDPCGTPEEISEGGTEGGTHFNFTIKVIINKF